MSGTRQYLVTIHDTGNITDDPRNIHTILTSRDFIAPRERVEVESTADLAERINWLHCLMQELEDNGVELPMGDYNDVYGILEDAREMLAGNGVHTPDENWS